MSNDPKSIKFRELLASVLSGEAGPDDYDLLGRLCTKSEDFSRELADELAFSEMIRQALVAHDFDAFESELAHQFEHRTEDLEELKYRLQAGEAQRPDVDNLALQIAQEDQLASELRDDLMFDDLLAQAVAPSRHEDAFLESLATRMWAQTQDDHFVEDIEKRLSIVEGGDEKIVLFPGKSGSRKKSSWVPAAVMGLGAAAAVVLGFFAIDRGWLEGPTFVADLQNSTIDAMWDEDSDPEKDGGFIAGKTYNLREGVMSMKFKNGTEMTVEGPSMFELIDDRQAVLHSGVALARTASVEEGFSLQSKGLNFVDSGNSIGVDARSDSATEAMIFNDGDGVGMCLPGQSRCRELYQYEAIRADLRRDKLLDIPYNPRVFSRAWELVAGVEKNAGSVKIELPGAGVAPDRTSSESVQVFVENDSFHTDEEIEVDSVKPGQFATATSDKSEPLTSESDLRSYLLQLWPEKVRENAGPVEATITFDHPIVGVIYSADKLEQSDSMVGTHLNEHDHAARGLDAGNDEILLSEDRRTMNVRLNSGDEDQLDHIRILVALN